MKFGTEYGAYMAFWCYPAACFDLGTRRDLIRHIHAR